MKIFDNLSPCTITNLWLMFIIITLFIGVLILVRILYKREKTLQMAEFSLSATGVKVTLGIDRDEKVDLLVKENIVLRKEIEVLKAANSKLGWKLILAYGLILIAAVVNKIKSNSNT